MEQVTLSFLVSLFVWVTGFYHNLHSLALRGTLALYERVVSLTRHLLYPLGKC